MFTIFHYSEPGGHDNQDAFAARAHPAVADCLRGAVADGQGGQPRGGPAARLACLACLEAAAAEAPEALFRPRTWARLGRFADEAVALDPGAGLTTLVAFAVGRGHVCGA